MSTIEKLGTFVESRKVQNCIIWLIVFNAILLGLETSPSIMADFGPAISAIDHAILAVFVAELLAKLTYRRLAFFRDGWNWFDLVVVGIALVPASGPLAVVRTLRVLRLLRLVSVVPSMRSVIEGLLRALPGMGSIAALILLIFYVSAVLTTNLYGADFPDLFGDLGASLFTLFQIMTLEAWGDIARKTMELHPASWIFFVIFILVTSFAVLNLFVGVIVNGMQSQIEEEHAVEEERAHDERALMLEEIRQLSAKLAQIGDELASVRATVEGKARG